MRKEWFTYCLRLLVLHVVLAFTWEIAFARITLSDNISSGTIKCVDADIQINTLAISGESTFVVLTGNVTINESQTLTVNQHATLIIEGDLTISKKSDLQVADGSIVIITHKMYVKNSGNTHIGLSSYFVCYEGIDYNKQLFFGRCWYQTPEADTLVFFKSRKLRMTVSINPSS